MSSTGAAKSEGPPPTFREVLAKASASAVRGGTAGAVAMGANVAALMWMRTTVSCCTIVSDAIYWLVRRYCISFYFI
jgi:hypothetical protein